MDSLFSDPLRLGKTIRRAREQAEMSQDDLATELGTTRQRLSKWELGKEPDRQRTPEQRRAFALAVAELTRARGLFGLSEPEPGEVDRLREEMRAELEAARAELDAEFDVVWRELGQPRPQPKPGDPG